MGWTRKDTAEYQAKRRSLAPEEVAYQKKRDSSLSRAAAKTKHKHNYIPCYFKYGYNWTNQIFYESGTYCPICGKIGEIHWLQNISVTDLDPSLPVFERDKKCSHIILN